MRSATPVNNRRNMGDNPFERRSWDENDSDKQGKFNKNEPCSGL